MGGTESLDPIRQPGDLATGVLARLLERDAPRRQALPSPHHRAHERLAGMLLLLPGDDVARGPAVRPFHTKYLLPARQDRLPRRELDPSLTPVGDQLVRD